MKPFDLEKALAGAPVQLRDGRKAVLVCRIPNNLIFRDGLPLRTRGGDKIYIVLIAESDNPLIKEQPVFGVINEVSSLRWKLDGSYLSNGEETPYDIVGLW